MGFNGNVSVHDMAETYMVPLQIMLEANVSSAMCAYDAINGTPSCANGWMSNTVLRKEWGFSGVIESDCGALSHIQVRAKMRYCRSKRVRAALLKSCLLYRISTSTRRTALTQPPHP